MYMNFPVKRHRNLRIKTEVPAQIHNYTCINTWCLCDQILPCYFKTVTCSVILFQTIVARWVITLLKHTSLLAVGLNLAKKKAMLMQTNFFLVYTLASSFRNKFSSQFINISMQSFYISVMCLLSHPESSVETELLISASGSSFSHLQKMEVRQTDPSRSIGFGVF
jgi:hypothetical protein